MKKKYLAFISLILSSSIHSPGVAADELSAVRNCLANWEEHPFRTAHPEFRVVSTSVKVFGIGNDVDDMVLIKPNVNVMGKAQMNLLNPNGWYCLYNKVNMLSKTTINTDCDAHIASASKGVTVLASNNEDEGVTVLGKAVINRQNCE